MRVGVIGMGSIGRRHARNLGALGHTPVVYDVDLQACGVAFGQTPEWETALSLYGLWRSELDAVLICTPPADHVPTALEGITAGVPRVFIEKPLSDRWGHNEEMLLEASQKCSTMVGCNMRYHPQVMEMRERLVNEPVVTARFWTQSYLPDWRPWQDYRKSYSAEIGAVLDCGSHELDLALWMLGPAHICSSRVGDASAIGLPGTDGWLGLGMIHDGRQVVSYTYADFVSKGYRRGSDAQLENGTTITYEWDRSLFDEAYLAEIKDFLEIGGQNPVSEASRTLQLLLEAKRCAKT